jgi:hypothetical protein
LDAVEVNLYFLGRSPYEAVEEIEHGRISTM